MVLGMHPRHRRLAVINLIGGPAVLASYAHGIATHEDPGRLWGSVPEAVQGLYTANMFFAAAGYLVFTWVLWRHVDPARARTLGGREFGWFTRCYALLLTCSTLWMPLSLYALDDATPGVAAALWGWIAAGEGDLPFTGRIEITPAADGGTQYRAIAMHADESGCEQHRQMGFEEGWGAALDQLVALMS